jgi:hypothetical protein
MKEAIEEQKRKSITNIKRMMINRIIQDNFPLVKKKFNQFVLNNP